MRSGEFSEDSDTADGCSLSDDRAQLLIVAAVGIAVLLTVLTLSLNAAVYGEVHVGQTDNAIHDEREAVEYQATVERAIAGMLPMTQANVSDPDEVEAIFRSDVERWDELSKREYARDGAATNVTVTDVTFRNRIVHDNETEPFTNRSGNVSEWTVASNVTDVDSFVMEVNSSALAANDECNSADECYTLEAEGDSGGIWEMYVYTSKGGGHEIIVNVDGDKHKTNETSVALDLAAGVFNDSVDEEENFTSFVDELDAPYTIRYADVYNVSGTYELEATTADGFDDEHFYPSDSNYCPRFDDSAKIVAANVSISYRSPALQYETAFRVEPGEDDG